MYKSKWLIVFLHFSLLSLGQEQESKHHIDFNGYVSDMQSVIVSEWMQEGIGNIFFQGITDSLPIDEVPWIKDNQLHNRLNFFWYGPKGLQASVQMRNRLNWGDQVLYGMLKNSKSSINELYFNDRELRLSHTDGINYLFQTELDRLWMQYTYESLEVRLGRQRISWAQTFAFNPNDIFNTYSYFDVDYPEKPGSDALRATYYLGMASKIEGAVKLNTHNKSTAAVMAKLNQWGYDFQLLGGYMNEKDYVIGAGWAGFVRNIGFRGETSYFIPMHQSKSSILVSAIGLDYAFTNSLFLQAEYLYNQLPEINTAGAFLAFYDEELSAKRLSISEHSVLVQASYPVNPLVNTSLGVLSYPAEEGFYVGPSVDISLSDNIQLSVIAQAFTMKYGGHRYNHYLGFIRIKGNF